MRVRSHMRRLSYSLRAGSAVKAALGLRFQQTPRGEPLPPPPPPPPPLIRTEDAAADADSADSEGARAPMATGASTGAADVEYFSFIDEARIRIEEGDESVVGQFRYIVMAYILMAYIAMAYI